MCYQCWYEYGQPRIVNERTTKAAELVHQLFEESSVGGNCHILVDDWNIETSHVNFCLDSSETELEKKVATAFYDMTLQERASALALEGRYFEIGEEADRG